MVEDRSSFLNVRPREADLCSAIGAYHHVTCVITLHCTNIEPWLQPDTRDLSAILWLNHGAPQTCSARVQADRQGDRGIEDRTFTRPQHAFGSEVQPHSFQIVPDRYSALLPLSWVTRPEREGQHSLKLVSTLGIRGAIPPLRMCRHVMESELYFFRRWF